MDPLVTPRPVGTVPTAARRNHGTIAIALGGVILPLLVGACTPTVRVEAPQEPIRIDLNVRIQQDVLIRLDESVKDLHAANPDIF